MDTIIDINTNKRYSVFSKKGKQIIKSYIKSYFSGGTQQLNTPKTYATLRAERKKAKKYLKILTRDNKKLREEAEMQIEQATNDYEDKFKKGEITEKEKNTNIRDSRNYWIKSYKKRKINNLDEIERLKNSIREIDDELNKPITFKLTVPIKITINRTGESKTIKRIINKSFHPDTTYAVFYDKMRELSLELLELYNNEKPKKNDIFFRYFNLGLFIVVGQQIFQKKFNNNTQWWNIPISEEFTTLGQVQELKYTTLDGEHSGTIGMMNTGLVFNIPNLFTIL